MNYKFQYKEKITYPRSSVTFVYIKNQKKEFHNFVIAIDVKYIYNKFNSLLKLRNVYLLYVTLHDNKNMIFRKRIIII